MIWFHSTSSRREPIGGWLMEISSLLIVFPWLDQAVGDAHTVHWRLPVACWLLAIPSCVAGIMLHKKSEGVVKRVPPRTLAAVCLPILTLLVAAYVAACSDSPAIERWEKALSGEGARVAFAGAGTAITVVACFLISHLLDGLEVVEEPRKPA